MKEITIAIGADHRGYAMKEYLKQNCTIPGYAFIWIDVGADSDARSDYPIFALRVAKYIQEQNADYGILLCGIGIGMAIAANRLEGIYAGLAWNEEVAAKAKEDDNVNVLVLPSDYIGNKKSRAMVIAWLGAEFKYMRYAERIAMIDAITQERH